MTVEERLKAQIGELVFAVAVLQTQTETQQARINELEAKVPKDDAGSKSGLHAV